MQPIGGEDWVASDRHRTAGVKTGWLLERRARPVFPPIPSRPNPGPPDRVDVPYAGSVRVLRQSERVAGHSEHVAHTQRVGAKHLGLQRHQVAVARGAVEDYVQRPLRLQTRCDGEPTGAAARRRRLGYVGTSGAGGGGGSGALQQRIQSAASWWLELDRNHEPTSVQRPRKGRTVRATGSVGTRGTGGRRRQ